MKRRNIKSVIHRKINDWLEHLGKDNKQLADKLQDKIIVTGGSIASMLLGEQVNDFDVYLRDIDAVEQLAQYYVSVFAKNPPPKLVEANVPGIKVVREHDRVKIVIKSAGIAGEDSSDATYKYFELSPDVEGADAEEYVAKAAAIAEDAETTKRPKYRPIFLSFNAITLSAKIQIVLRFFGEPDAIHENYDYVHCMNYWTSWDNELVLRPEALESLLAKDLRYIGSRYPICSVVRLRKFLERGWQVSAGQIVKICWQISQLNLEDIDTLEDQLTGVDTAYFMEVIDILRAGIKRGKKIDATYLSQVIDRVFG